MTFTYSSTDLSTVLAKVRLEVGDTDSAAPLFTDEELQRWITARADNVLLAAADACDSLARKFARRFDFKSDNQAFSRSQMSKQYAALARDLRDRASGVSSVATTRVDGFSQDITTEDVLSVSQNPRGRYRRLDDAPF